MIKANSLNRLQLFTCTSLPSRLIPFAFLVCMKFAAARAAPRRFSGPSLWSIGRVLLLASSWQVGWPADVGCKWMQAAWLKLILRISNDFIQISFDWWFVSWWIYVFSIQISCMYTFCCIDSEIVVENHLQRNNIFYKNILQGISYLNLYLQTKIFLITILK